ncbi:cytochrome P450 [Paracraurococcus lichenis]|uniref:Cytochrome P450 n=1 Tax=Paracraurococcus lichenis TaxID=3064888 RepID=A0ABT9E919_9PROT|nr:cytochrome P450 [Paracraurococcus sp. LOR1-02]MDO9712617.1 cytochrome P450 [Paracraurococcus sp. LOR1-02]
MDARVATAPKSSGSKLLDALKSKMDWGFLLLRNTLPILVVPWKGRTYALVTRYDDVQEVLQRPNVFNVTYAPKIAVIMDGDNIFLGMKDEPNYTRDRTNMRMTAPRGEALSRVKPEVARLTAEAVQRALPGGRLDLAMELTQDVTTRFFGAYFGTPGRSVTQFSDQVRWLFGWMFADIANDPAKAAPAARLAADLRAYVEEAIAARKQARGQQDDILERCLRFQDMGTEGFSDREIRNNLIGLIVGALPQAPMVIPQLFDILLDRPQQLREAQAAARADDDAAVSRYVFEASRFFPLTPGLFRNCEEDYRVAAGNWRARTIPKGAFVMAATRSAMFDGRRVPRSWQFRTDRPDYSYMHFGYGMHECFGLYMNRVMVPEICKAVLKLPNLRRAPGPEGRLRMDEEFGIFPMNLTVAFG